MSVAVSVAATGTVERVVVVVLNWNREADTRECLASLDADRSAPHTILLVDNASEDGSGARLHAHFPGVAYLQTAENLGYAGGNNAGIAWALDHGAEFVFVLNNDTVVPAGCLQTLLAALESSPAMAAVAPTILRHAHPDQMWWAGGHFSATKGLGVSHLDSPRPDAPALVPCTFLSGCALLMRAEALRSLGGFRADYFAYLEDVEWGVRAMQSGWRLGWVPAARLLHKVPARGTSDSPFQITMRDRNRRRLVRTHLGVVQRICFHAWFWPTRALTAFRYLLAGDRARLTALWKGALSP